MDIPFIALKDFYKLSHAQEYLEENPPGDEIDVIDIVELPPPVSDLTDEEDLDDDVLEDNENSDPTYVPADVVGTIEIHQGNVTEVDTSELDIAQRKIKDIQWKKTNPSYTKLD